jgi:hypothetical protein
VDNQVAKWFNSVKFLIPEGCLVGSGDELLGTFEGLIPNNSAREP